MIDYNRLLGANTEDKTLVIEELYDDIHAYVIDEKYDFTNQELFDESPTFEIKELIVGYVAIRLHSTQYIHEGETARIEKRIQDAIATLKKYEPNLLNDNQFDRKPYTKFSQKDFSKQQRVITLHRFEALGIPEYKAKKMMVQLDKFSL